MRGLVSTTEDAEQPLRRNGWPTRGASTLRRWVRHLDCPVITRRMNRVLDFRPAPVIRLQMRSEEAIHVVSFRLVSMTKE